MTDICCALIVRDDAGGRLAVLGTGREPKTLHGKITPGFFTLCASLLTLYPAAVSIDTVSWREGVDVEQAPVLLIVRRTERAGELVYSFCEPESEPEMGVEVQA